MMLFTQTRGLPVITAEEAATLGTVDGLTIDARTRSIACLRLAGARKGRAVIDWSAVEAVGHDAVIVRSRVAAESGPGDVPEHREAVGSRVLTEYGVEHGTVKDVGFDPGSGRVLTLYTALGDIAGDHLIGLGSYAVVVRGERG
ncbi:PRC-barrel domain-containing protein [Streptomyces sp. 5-8]|uniref:PRC-barrel domain-containing protein n=1 Tax=Streptomyces musisoli TaxID=2802280 RepID=A0ABS1NWF8_9ACTN|nr:MULTISPECIES: PRC-barrel domain-containing protein [Streptomyces]MBL1104339.1 PRC-barrel domain-containing protein [Streptomyces musisoli]MBY8840311.1 PRC-barrel domain-containing protein [Streptomyces sp. SP2-10]